MTQEEAIARLNAIDWGPDGKPDAMVCHEEADDILLQMVPKPVAEAFERCRERVQFWYA
jgi:hypothetical protein